MSLMGGSRGWDRESGPPSIFQNMGFCNGKICRPTPGLKVVPHEKSFLDPRMSLMQFLTEIIMVIFKTNNQVKI